MSHNESASPYLLQKESELEIADLMTKAELQEISLERSAKSPEGIS